MIRWVTSVLVIAFLLAVMPRYADAGQPVSVAPSGGSAVKVKVGGKEQTYYSLTSSGRLQLKLDGPGKLTIMSRVILPGGGAGEVEYALALREKGAWLDGRPRGANARTRPCPPAESSENCGRCLCAFPRAHTRTNSLLKMPEALLPL
jgi:hypothetical protein